jgi:hypothetical protein
VLQVNVRNVRFMTGLSYLISYVCSSIVYMLLQKIIERRQTADDGLHYCMLVYP